jgi:hypothetical protein
MQTHLLEHLRGEFWQTETSASQHCRREAARLGDTAPARALSAAAQHADDTLATLPKLFQGGRSTHKTVGAAVGKLFSELRDTLADNLLTSERSYRGTLLGLRHGVDLVRLMLASTSHDSGDVRLFLEAWLARREPLIAEVAKQFSWFAEHQDQALKHARGLFGPGVRQTQARAAEHRAQS